MLRPMGQDNQFRVEKVPLEIDLKRDFFHILPVIGGIVRFPKFNCLVQSFEIGYL